MIPNSQISRTRQLNRTLARQQDCDWTLKEKFVVRVFISTLFISTMTIGVPQKCHGGMHVHMLLASSLCAFMMATWQG